MVLGPCYLQFFFKVLSTERILDYIQIESYCLVSFLVTVLSIGNKLKQCSVLTLPWDQKAYLGNIKWRLNTARW